MEVMNSADGFGFYIQILSRYIMVLIDVYFTNEF